MQSIQNMWCHILSYFQHIRNCPTTEVAALHFNVIKSSPPFGFYEVENNWCRPHWVCGTKGMYNTYKESNLSSFDKEWVNIKIIILYIHLNNFKVKTPPSVVISEYGWLDIQLSITWTAGNILWMTVWAFTLYTMNMFCSVFLQGSGSSWSNCKSTRPNESSTTTSETTVQ